jgi:hypothetical protein
VAIIFSFTGGSYTTMVLATAQSKNCAKLTTTLGDLSLATRNREDTNAVWETGWPGNSAGSSGVAKMRRRLP